MTQRQPSFTLVYEMDFASRQDRFCRLLDENHLPAFLVTHLANVRYLCGFTGSAGVLACKPANARGDRKFAFFTDGRYTQQAREQVKNARVVIAKRSALAAAVSWIGEASPIGIEADHVTVALQKGIATAKAPGTRLKPTSAVVEKLRMVKDAEELERIRRAVYMGAELFPRVIKTIAPGIREVDVAAELEFAARKAGAEAMSFETIVAAGPRSALPHGQASETEIPRKGFVVLDFGVILAGYCSDMTRTVHVGRATREDRRLYDAVLAAQLAAISAVRPGTTVAQVDHAARRVLEKAGFGRYFTHSTGHGVGLEIHEAPRVGKNGTDVLRPGMVITIEPGAYVSGRGGVRIEDMVVVTESGCEVLTPTSKDWIEI